MTKVLLDRLLTALYAREPHVKVAVAATGGGTSATELLFRAGSSSTILQFSVPYARAALEGFVHTFHTRTTDRASESSRTRLTKFCAPDTASLMGIVAWHQAQAMLQADDDEDDDSGEKVTKACGAQELLDRYRHGVGVGCTAALATNYEKKGPHQCFISVCRVQLAEATDVRFLQRRCQTYHLNLDKTSHRCRREEDQIVSEWMVYLLAKAAEVDSEGCEALLTALTNNNAPGDSFQLVDDTLYPDQALDAVTQIGLVATSQLLTSLAFVPGDQARLNASVEDVVGVRDLPFRGLVLPGSFNPLHRGHVELALAAQRLIRTVRHQDLPIAFEIAIANADKGAIDANVVHKRVQQFHANHPELQNWPVLVTNATLFLQKAQLLPGCVFIIGADTAVRIVDKKYYDNDEHKMILLLDRIARQGCSFVVAGRFDDKLEQRYISAHEVLAHNIPPVFRDFFLPLDEGDFRIDLSSSAIRKQLEPKN
ncbi:TPA: hypothetical protein N0F65_001697 [Lagenidium giganteum]|uniref:Cytidyltransferase-like domain-containing protein n=1 Tax=Lagenidium giganteum TaxID=4803 RepID=A0AAV2YMA6_9STRA|nr:TPA: hypothetical protein N0F65_001697 [Lagenidium giganteum]